MTPERPARPFITTGDNSIDFQPDPRFEHKHEINERLGTILERFIRSTLTPETIEEIKTKTMHEIMNGLQRREVYYPSKTHPKNMPQRFKHDCPECVYLGNGAMEKKVFNIDLHFCKKSNLIVKRYGERPEQSDSCSILDYDEDINIWIAWLLAQEKDLIPVGTLETLSRYNNISSH